MHQKQYGLRKNSTTELAVNQIEGDLADEKKFVIFTVFQDLAKAFITVFYEILLSKIKGYKVKGFMLNLLQSYLSNRSQSFIINNVVFERKIVNDGIPQGSCFDPLLFICI